MKQKTTAQKINLLQASVDKYIGRTDGIWLELWIGEIRRCVSTLDDEVATMGGYTTLSPEEQMITTAITELKELQKSLDPECAHPDADDILLRFVPEEVKAEWEKVDKWYA